jgi:ISXO2-like transposase domain
MDFVVRVAGVRRPGLFALFFFKGHLAEEWSQRLRIAEGSRLEKLLNAWTWLHRFRRAMIRPGRELLSGRVEGDECYIGSPEDDPCGRGNVDKTLVVVAVQEDGKGIGRVRFRQIPDASAGTLNLFIKESVEPGSYCPTASNAKSTTHASPMACQYHAVASTAICRNSTRFSR